MIAKLFKRLMLALVLMVTSCAAVLHAAFVQADTPPAPTVSAVSVLEQVPVAQQVAHARYRRSAFGVDGWIKDHYGCYVHDSVLRRDLTRVVVKPFTYGCGVLSGMLLDPYTGRRVTYVRGARHTVEVDHVVALANAWRSGADGWTYSARVQFANDPLNLLAVSTSANQDKGDSDAARWLPPSRAFRCAYVARQIIVKAKYHLGATSSEMAAFHQVLKTCPGQVVPTDAGSALPAP